MKALLSVIAVAAAACALTAADASAQARRAAAKNATSIVVTNMRQVAVSDLTISTATDTPVGVARLTKPLAPGKSITLPIKGKRGCVFNVAGNYQGDEPFDAESVDFCADNKLRLTD